MFFPWAEHFFSRKIGVCFSQCESQNVFVSMTQKQVCFLQSIV